MADITWSAYALAMFTEEQRAAAVAQVLPPEIPEPLRPRDPVYGLVPSVVPIAGLNPNNPDDLKKISAAGWVYRNGQWVKLTPGTNPLPIGHDQALVAGSSSFQPTGAVVPGGSVLGFTVPTAPAVLLPSFVGGRLGEIRMGGGMRPAAGGTPKRVVMGPGSAVFPAIRIGVTEWGR